MTLAKVKDPNELVIAVLTTLLESVIDTDAFLSPVLFEVSTLPVTVAGTGAAATLVNENPTVASPEAKA